MAQNHSFDIVSEIDFQEADNAVNQALKEIHQRYDLKDSNTQIELNKKDKLLTLNTKDDYSRKSSIDILETKFIRRNISIKALKFNEPEAAAGGRLKQVINLQSDEQSDHNQYNLSYCIEQILTKLFLPQ